MVCNNAGIYIYQVLKTQYRFLVITGKRMLPYSSVFFFKWLAKRPPPVL